MGICNALRPKSSSSQERTEVGRLLNCHYVTWLTYSPQSQTQCLRRSSRDDEIIRTKTGSPLCSAYGYISAQVCPSRRQAVALPVRVKAAGCSL
ncbi:Uncharacterised protein [Klebsiella pneumoniae]|uniref:Uncharacterized protein n=1 Tax=Klebsiella pneumoniae TaxID=573 RepID=A0A2X3EFK2_KLEPN|nr:Uncharacterised protein [Klebsiella pneumoniae]